MIYVIIYSTLPEEACYIREAVFVDEQGFTEEFVKYDICATHFVLFVDAEPVATCRVFQEDNRYILGRIAVMPGYRRQGLGSAIIHSAESYVAEQGGHCLHLHAQCRITDFYEAIGYDQYGEVEEDQGCPHIWMMKTI